MRLVSWNIRAGGGKRIERIAAQLAVWRPDIVVLSEFRATPPSRWLADFVGNYGLHHQRTTASAVDPARNALLVASRWPLRRLSHVGASSDAHRWLAVTVATPTPIQIGALHVPNKATGRKYAFQHEALSVVSRWRRRPALVVGDTNSGRAGIDEEVACFGAGEERFFDGFEELGWTDAFRQVRGRARAYTWYSPNGGNGFRLDQAMVNPRLQSHVERVAYRWGRGARGALSDHAALLVDLAD